MFENIFYIFLAGLIFCMPVLFWMYVCTSSFHHPSLSRGRFFLGIFAGALSAAVFSYLPNSHFSFLLENIFREISRSAGNVSLEYIFFPLLILILLLSLIIGIWNIICKKNLHILGFSLMGYTLLICIVSLGIIYFLRLFSGEISELSFFGYSFLTLGAVLSYYSIIALSEEGIKYFSSLGGVTRSLREYKKSFLLLGVSIALGFSFFETGLYSYFYISQNSINGELVQLIFFRNIFSLSLHVLCSLLMSLGFWYVLFVPRSELIRKIGFFALLSLVSLGVHVIFDVSLQFGFIGIIFLIVAVLYIFFSYIMGEQEAK